jgi:hypothetical protein
MEIKVWHSIGAPRLCVEDKAIGIAQETAIPACVMVDMARACTRHALVNMDENARADMIAMAREVLEAFG